MPSIKGRLQAAYINATLGKHLPMAERMLITEMEALTPTTRAAAPRAWIWPGAGEVSGEIVDEGFSLIDKGIIQPGDDIYFVGGNKPVSKMKQNGTQDLVRRQVAAGISPAENSETENEYMMRLALARARKTGFTFNAHSKRGDKSQGASQVVDVAVELGANRHPHIGLIILPYYARRFIGSMRQHAFGAISPYLKYPEKSGITKENYRQIPFATASLLAEAKVYLLPTPETAPYVTARNGKPAFSLPVDVKAELDRREKAIVRNWPKPSKP